MEAARKSHSRLNRQAVFEKAHSEPFPTFVPPKQYSRLQHASLVHDTSIPFRTPDRLVDGPTPWNSNNVGGVGILYVEPRGMDAGRIPRNARLRLMSTLD